MDEHKFTKQEILLAVREELIYANNMLNISKGFKDEDYEYIGVVSAAIERLEQKTPAINEQG